MLHSDSNFWWLSRQFKNLGSADNQWPIVIVVIGVETLLLFPELWQLVQRREDRGGRCRHELLETLLQVVRYHSGHATVAMGTVQKQAQEGRRFVVPP